MTVSRAVGVNDGDEADAAAGTPDGAALDGGDPDAGADVPFEDRSWGDLEMIDFARHPQVAIDADGDVMTLWEWLDYPEPTRCFVRRRAFATSSWGPEHDLVTPAAVSAALPRPAGTTVAAVRDFCEHDAFRGDDAGRAIALFIHVRSLEYENGATQGSYTGMRAMFDPAFGWEEPAWIGQNSSSLQHLALGMNAPGAAIALWEQDQLWAAEYQPEGGWAEPAIVAGTDEYRSLRAVLDGHGDGLGLMEVGDLFSDRLSAARLEAGVWSAPEPVGDADGEESLTDVAMNVGGVALVVWRHCTSGPRCEVRARRFEPVAGWDAPITIGAIDDSVDISQFEKLQVAIDEQGNGLAVWAVNWPDPDGSELRLPRLRAARFRDGAWMDAETLYAGGLGDSVRNPRVVLDRAGNGLVAWRWQLHWTWDSDYDPHGEYLVRSYMPGSGFGPREALDVNDGALGISHIKLAMNGSGVGVAAWSIGETGARQDVPLGGHFFGCSAPAWQVTQVTSVLKPSFLSLALMEVVIFIMPRAMSLCLMPSLEKSSRSWQKSHWTPSALETSFMSFLISAVSVPAG